MKQINSSHGRQMATKSNSSGQSSATLGQLKDEIVRTLDVINWYEKYTNGQRIKSRGPDWSERVLCPLHNDQTTPSFFVNAVTGGFKCHACGKSGSIFDFWMLKHIGAVDTSKIVDACAALANDAGLDIAKWQLTVKAAPPTIKNAKTPKALIPEKNKADSNDSLRKPIPSDIIEKFQRGLKPEHYKYMLTKRGLKKKAIDEACIGFDSAWPWSKDGKWYHGRYTIPVRAADKTFRNIRGYAPNSESAFKMANFVIDKKKATEAKFGSPPRLYNLDKLLAGNYQTVVICEGEFDSMLLNQMLEELNFQTWIGVTGTHGVKTFEAEWLTYLKGKDILLCFDCDDEGKLAAHNIATSIFLPALNAGIVSSVKIIDLPLDGSKEMNDITDYFMKAEGTIENLIEVFENTPFLIAGGLSGDDAAIEAVDVPDLVTAIKDRRYIDTRIKVPITINGTTSRVYHAIREYRVSKCSLMEDGECCCQSVGTQVIPYGHNLFIKSCMQKEGQNIKDVAEMTCQKDQRCRISVLSKVVMEEYFAHQVVKRWRAEEQEGRLVNSQELVQSPIYVLQPAKNIDIQPQNYIATGWIRTHPHTSMATLFVEHLEAMEEDWKNFSVETPENLEILKKLKDMDLDEIIEEITNGVTKIYEADHILYAVLLTYLSPLWFSFNSTLLRGWLNIAIIGDSGTGKSMTYLRLSDWLELGDLFSALSGTRTGLLYAVKQRNGEWLVSIGRYVQASCKIIAVDETQETTPEEIKKMAVAMETGFLRVEQVASGGYHTQTRTIFLLNPKNSAGKAATLSEFSIGADALKECFDPMFIRRLDLAVFVSSGRDYEFYNRKNIDRPVSTVKLTAHMMKTLVYWAWTRKPHNIHWTSEATETCLNEATRLSEMFGHADDTPLVSPNDFRENLARVSTAYSVLARNFTEDFQGITILPVHVKAMANYVESLYNMPECNLRHKSKLQKVRSTLEQEDFDKIKVNFEECIQNAARSPNAYYSSGKHFEKMILLFEQTPYIKKRDLADQLNVSLRWVQARISALQSYNLIESNSRGYRVTKKFNIFMRRWRDDTAIEKLLDDAHSMIGEDSLFDMREEKQFEDDTFSGVDDPFTISEVGFDSSKKLDPFD